MRRRRVGSRWSTQKVSPTLNRRIEPYLSSSLFGRIRCLRLALNCRLFQRRDPMSWVSSQRKGCCNLQRSQQSGQAETSRGSLKRAFLKRSHQSGTVLQSSGSPFFLTALIPFALPETGAYSSELLSQSVQFPQRCKSRCPWLSTRNPSLSLRADR